MSKKKKQTRAQYLERKRKHAEREGRLAATPVSHLHVSQKLEDERIERIEERERKIVEQQRRERDAFLQTLTPEEREVWIKKDHERQMRLARVLGSMAGMGMLGGPYGK